METYFIVVWIIIEACLVHWLIRGKPNKTIMSKYSKQVLFMIQLPFGKKWKNKIDRSDVEIFEIYQQRIKIWYLSLVIPMFLFFVYFFMKYSYLFEVS